MMPNFKDTDISLDEAAYLKGVAFPCPSCGKQAIITYDGDCAHEKPTCARYDALENLEQASDYMQEARKKLLAEQN